MDSFKTETSYHFVFTKWVNSLVWVRGLKHGLLLPVLKDCSQGVISIFYHNKEYKVNSDCNNDTKSHSR